MRKRTNLPMVGISLLTLIFICLCLIIFAVLSLQNAVSDQHLSQKAADYTTAYFGAVSGMELCKKEIHDQLAALWTEVSDSEENVDNIDLYDIYKRRVKENNWTEGIFQEKEDGTLEMHFEEKVTDRQNLVMELRLCEPDGDQYYEVTKWQLESNDDWEADRSLPVYQGEEGE